MCRHYGRAEPAPPGGQSKARWPYGGKPGSGAKVGSLGGARSPRPHCEALPMPGHFITRGGWPGGRSIMGTCLGQAGVLLRTCGARPSAGGQTQRGWPHGGKPGDNAEGDFPGGTRSPRPQIRAGPKPGHVIATHGSAKGPWAKRGNVVVCVMPSLRACGARPSEGWASQCRMALWGKPWDNVEGRFLGGMRSARPQRTAQLKPGHVMITGGGAKDWWPKGNKI